MSGHLESTSGSTGAYARIWNDGDNQGTVNKPHPYEEEDTNAYAFENENPYYPLAQRSEWNGIENGDIPVAEPFSSEVPGETRSEFFPKTIRLLFTRVFDIVQICKIITGLVFSTTIIILLVLILFILLVILLILLLSKTH